MNRPAFMRVSATTGLPVLRPRAGGGIFTRAGRAVGDAAWGSLNLAGRAIDAAVFVVAPGWGQRRVLAREACNRLRAGYDAAAKNRLTAGKILTQRDADSELQGKAGRIRAFARDEARNNAIARNLKNTHKHNTVGDADVGQGYTIDPAVLLPSGKPDEKTNAALKTLWERFRDRLEYTGRWGFADMLAINDCELTEAGEVLNILHTRGAPGNPLPFSIEQVEADRLPTSNESFAAGGLGTNGEILIADETGSPALDPRTQKPIVHTLRHGIEYDQNKQMVAFHVLKDHPGQEQLAGTVFQTQRILAENVIHYFRPERAEQTRGVSWFVVILSLLSNLYELINWELLAAKAQAVFGLHFGGSTTPNMGVPSGSTTNPPTDANGNVVTQVQPGMMTVGDTKAEFYQSNRPGGTFLPFCMQLVRLCGAGFGMGYSAASKDYGQGAYSALRQEDNEDARAYRDAQGLHARHFCKRIWPRFVKACAEAGLTPFSLREYMGDADRLSRCAIGVPGRAHINPLQEVVADAVSVANGFKDLDEVANVSGKEPADRLEALGSQKDKAEKLGLSLGWAVGKPKPGINAAGALKAAGAEPEDVAAADQADQTGDEGDAPEDDVQKSALNGAQVTALQEIVQAVADGKLPETAAVEMVLVAFPDMDRPTAQKILKSAAAFEPKPEPEPQPAAQPAGAANDA